jgi:hydroxymethylglutaryl-CoA synthase
MEAFANFSRSDSYTNRDIEKAFMRFTDEAYKKKVLDSLVVPKNVGNMYCASVYGGLVSLLGNMDSEVLLGKRIVLFSYGSGLAASMFSLKVKGSVAAIKKKLNIAQRLADRTVIEPAEYDQIMLLREKTHNVKSYTPSGPVSTDNLFPGTYYLVGIDEKFRRSYERFPIENCN